MATWELLVASAYYCLFAPLAVLGLHRLCMVILFLRHRRRRVAPPPGEEALPVVTVQLPVYNERYVAERLVDAACRLRWPRDRLEIQVLDDSTDETVEILAGRVAGLRAEGHDVHHLRRGHRAGFKAGALEAGLRSARGELVAVFDADFLPDPDFLERTVPHFRGAPRLGMVQARWEHLNRDHSLLTALQALMLDGHFVVEHTARNRSGRFFNFNGTAGVWRRRCVEEAGGWQHDTLTEDMDLSYRAQLAGWRFLYLPEVAVPAELPVEMNAFKAQQHRWAKGSIQTFRKLLRSIWSSAAPLRVKAEATVHLGNNLAYLLMAAVSLFMVPSLFVRIRHAEVLHTTVLDGAILLATAAILLFYAASQVFLPSRPPARSLLFRVLLIPGVMALGIGISLSNARGVLQALARRDSEFVRTPKYAIIHRKDSWAGKGYLAAVNLLPLAEVALGLVLLGGVVAAAAAGLLPTALFASLFAAGFLYVGLRSLLPLLAAARGGGGPAPWKAGRRTAAA